MGLGWSSMVTRRGAFYLSLGKEFYTKNLEKKSKDLINIKTTVKGVNISLDRTLLAHIASILTEDQPLPLAPLLVLFSEMRSGNTMRTVIE